MTAEVKKNFLIFTDITILSPSLWIGAGIIRKINENSNPENICYHTHTKSLVFLNALNSNEAELQMGLITISKILEHTDSINWYVDLPHIREVSKKYTKAEEPQKKALSLILEKRIAKLPTLPSEKSKHQLAHRSCSIARGLILESGLDLENKVELVKYVIGRKEFSNWDVSSY